MTKKTTNTNTTSVNRRQAIAGAGAAAGSLAITGPALASSSQAMTLWREWGAAKCGVGLAIDGPNEQQAEEAIINLSDATPASAIVKLAVRLDFESMGDNAAVHSAYTDLKAMTGLDPIAELNTGLA